MKAVVVYESMYGNTRRIAEAIGVGLAALGKVGVGSVSEIAPSEVDGVDLLVVGGPTHMHGMSRSGSRKAAMEVAETHDNIDAEPDAAGPGLRDWFKELPEQADALGAAFDTRIDKPEMLTGSAAKGIAKQLRRHHFQTVGEPQSFFVDESDGPLHAGEINRAQLWGVELVARCCERAVEA